MTFLRRDGRSQAVGFGSGIEHDVALCCIYRPDFLDLEEQLEKIMVRKTGTVATPYWLDYRLTLTSGRRIAISVKFEAEARTLKYQRTIRAVRDVAVPEIAEQLNTVTERNIDPTHLANCKLFHAARFPEVALGDRVTEALSQLDQPMPIWMALDQAGIGPDGFWSAVRAIRWGDVEVMSRGIIDEHAVIRPLTAIGEAALCRFVSRQKKTSTSASSKWAASSVRARAEARSPKCATMVSWSTGRSGHTR
ncbi:hypothetical protein [Sagittula sp. S175]|uniref:hypothetical protein n=1 Tax=Sagittula sp. S175 TaxID=3415129 RepID=UPI003C7E8FE4